MDSSEHCRGEHMDRRFNQDFLGNVKLEYLIYFLHKNLNICICLTSSFSKHVRRLFGFDPSMLALSYMWLCDLDRRRNIQCNARTPSLRKAKDNNILSRLHLDRGLTLLSWVPFLETWNGQDAPIILPSSKRRFWSYIYIYLFSRKISSQLNNSKHISWKNCCVWSETHVIFFSCQYFRFSRYFHFQSGPSLLSCTFIRFCSLHNTHRIEILLEMDF